MRGRLIALAALALAGCATTQGGAGAEERRHVEAVLPAGEAAARVQAAFLAEGITVEQAQPALVVGTARDDVGLGERAGTYLRVSASLIPAGDSTRVVVTGVATRPAAFGLPEASAAVTNRGRGTEGAMWRRLERLAAAIRGGA